VTKLEVLLLDKTRILQTFLDCAKKYRDLLLPKSESVLNSTADEKLNWVDELTSERESHFRVLQLIDGQLELERILIEPETLEKLQGTESFKAKIEQILHLGKEIQLTDQSLILYINNIGFEIRAQILKGLKEKEAISKFKSLNQSPTGEGFDQKA
jgi:gluconate kinase